MDIKKILLVIICLFVFTGCKVENISNSDIESNVETIVNKKIKYLNTNAIGYQYYLPEYMSVKNVNDFNQELYYNGNTFYLYADVVSYYHKIENEYKIDDNAYISMQLENKNKKGYLEVNEEKGKYYIEMMYNYAKVEAYVSKVDLIDSISSISYILSSIKYNNNVVESILGNNKYDLSGNETYNIFKTKKKTEGNFLDDVNKYDVYTGDDSSAESLIEKEEINSTKEED